MKQTTFSGPSSCHALCSTTLIISLHSCPSLETNSPHLSKHGEPSPCGPVKNATKNTAQTVWLPAMALSGHQTPLYHSKPNRYLNTDIPHPKHPTHVWYLARFVTTFPSQSLWPFWMNGNHLSSHPESCNGEGEFGDIFVGE